MTQTPEKPSITDVTNSQKDWEDFWNSENIDADFWMPELGDDPMAHRFKEILPHHPTRDEVDEMIPNRAQPIVTLYWHVLDHARDDGKWLPPLR